MLVLVVLLGGGSVCGVIDEVRWSHLVGGGGRNGIGRGFGSRKVGSRCSSGCDGVLSGRVGRGKSMVE